MKVRITTAANAAALPAHKRRAKVVITSMMASFKERQLYAAETKGWEEIVEAINNAHNLHPTASLEVDGVEVKNLDECFATLLSAYEE